MEKPEVMKLDRRIPCAVVDTTFAILRGNPAFYRWQGERQHSSVLDHFTGESADRIKAAASKLGGEKNRVKLVVYLDGEDQIPMMFTIYLRKDGKMDIALYDSFYMVEIFEENAFQLEQYRSLLSMEGDAVFEFAGDTGEFSLYWMNNEENIYFYQGSFVQWMEEMIVNGDIDDGDLSIFMDFCRDIQEHRSKFNYQFRNKVISKDNTMETSRIMARTVVNMDGNYYTVGLWSLYNEAVGTKQDQLLKEFYIDPLTEVMVKKDVISYAQALISRRTGRNVVLCIIDIDNFKSVNDHYGHLFGDMVLRESAQAIRRSIGAKGVVGRIGGDEFLAVLENVQGEAEIRNILRAVKSSFQWIYPDKLKDINFGCSIGAARYPKDGYTYTRVFHIADNALYLAKAMGKNAYVIYDEKKHGSVKEGDSSLSLIKTVFHQTKALEVGRMLTELVSREREGVEGFLRGFADLYQLDRIQIACGQLREPMYSACLGETQPSFLSYTEDDHYLSLYQGKKYFSLPQVHQLKYSEPEIYQCLLSQGIETTFQYRLGTGEEEIKGVIAIDKCTKPVEWGMDVVNVFVMVCSILEGMILKAI